MSGNYGQTIGNKEAEKRMKKLIKRELGVTVKKSELSAFLNDYWSQISYLAHVIHTLPESEKKSRLADARMRGEIEEPTHEQEAVE